MKFFCKMKDGGPKSPVDAYVLFEIKSLFSIMLLKFNKGQRESYHTHAFNALTWFLSGDLLETSLDGKTHVYSRGIFPKVTPRDMCHRVTAFEDSWCFTVRGPWNKYWFEYENDKTTVLTHGRKVVKNV